MNRKYKEGNMMFYGVDNTAFDIFILQYTYMLVISFVELSSLEKYKPSNTIFLFFSLSAHTVSSLSTYTEWRYGSNMNGRWYTKSIE